MTKLIILSCLAALVFCVPHSDAQSKPLTSGIYRATRLLQECRAAIADYDSKDGEIGPEGEHCLGYVQGQLDMALMWQVANRDHEDAMVPRFCLTPKATNEVIIRRIPI